MTDQQTDSSQQPQQQAQQQAQQQRKPLDFTVVLASASPRRAELLARAGVDFIVHVAPVDETLEPEQLANPAEACTQLAERKAGAVVQQILSNPEFEGMMIVIGADTMVVESGEIFGKPVDLDDARRMLSRLSGVTHQVMTGVSVWLVQADRPGEVSLGHRSFADISQVTFKPLTMEDIDKYLAVGESMDKAGAYAVQGAGGALVSKVEGALDTVIGLPAERLLREFPDLKQR